MHGTVSQFVKNSENRTLIGLIRLISTDEEYKAFNQRTSAAEKNSPMLYKKTVGVAR